MEKTPLAIAAAISVAIMKDDWPESFNSYQRHEIKKLYDAGKVRDAQAMWQDLIDNPAPQTPTLL